MMATEELNLRLTPDAVTAFCREVTRGADNPGRQHAALVALAGFVARHAGAAAHTPVCDHILAIIREFSEGTRERLLQAHAEALSSALRDGYRPGVARIHASVSRTGFQEVLGRALMLLPAEDRARIADEILDWCATAERAAGEASGYPDAMDFRAAGIDLGEYRALSDIRLRLLPGKDAPGGE
ncbi:MAG TPA: hypothetical protein ENK50_04765 [Sedimenticola sp.]|nr:hypothetical protein [Sedimenticola sp.]